MRSTIVVSIAGLVACSAAQPASEQAGRDAAAVPDGTGTPVPDAPGDAAPPDPQPAFQGFTAVQHWDNSNPVDWYPNGELGPHKGWELVLPYAGTVTRMQTQSPLGTAMYTAIITFDTPVAMPSGPPIRVMWFTHVRGDVVQGHRAAGQTIATCWDSGIEFEAIGIAAEAAHFHVGASSTALDPNGVGNIPAFDALRALGFQPRIIPRIPGPMDYLGGGWFRGKPKMQAAASIDPPVDVRHRFEELARVHGHAH